MNTFSQNAFWGVIVLWWILFTYGMLAENHRALNFSALVSVVALVVAITELIGGM